MRGGILCLLFLFRPGGDEGYIELNFSLRKLFLPEGHTYLEELLT